jgi:hypothetical protein
MPFKKINGQIGNKYFKEISIFEKILALFPPHSEKLREGC